MEKTVKSNTSGSSTIKRNGAIVKGTKGNGIAHLINRKGNVSISANRKSQNA
ncbi:hypothetical protein [Neobacillus sp. FSL H8-0543]|uniref:hypothetical protein n=1 Tax=Neobacillus sp. FSL H8-0543 TaxID=2954672 RepID=UPI0031597631